MGDDRWYVWEPFGAGWGIDDPIFDYGAPVSALTLNDNAFTLRIRPGANEGDLAALELNPPVEYYTIDNRIRTTAGGERRIHYSRAPGGIDAGIVGQHSAAGAPQRKIGARISVWASTIRRVTRPWPFGSYCRRAASW